MLDQFETLARFHKLPSPLGSGMYFPNLLTFYGAFAKDSRNQKYLTSKLHHLSVSLFLFLFLFVFVFPELCFPVPSPFNNKMADFGSLEGGGKYVPFQSDVPNASGSY